MVAPQILPADGFLPADHVVRTALVSYGCLANDSRANAKRRPFKAEHFFEESVTWYLSR
jgi:hypothetical protein